MAYAFTYCHRLAFYGTSPETIWYTYVNTHFHCYCYFTFIHNSVHKGWFRAKFARYNAKVCHVVPCVHFLASKRYFTFNPYKCLTCPAYPSGPFATATDRWPREMFTSTYCKHSSISNASFRRSVITDLTETLYLAYYCRAGVEMRSHGMLLCFRCWNELTQHVVVVQRLKGGHTARRSHSKP